MKEHENGISTLSAKESIDLYLSLSDSKKGEFIPLNRGANMDLGSDFPGNQIKNADFEKCRFTSTVFDGANAQYSTFLECQFVDCSFSSSNFQYCNFTMSSISDKERKRAIQGSNFSYGDLTKVHLHNLQFEGVSFCQTLFSGGSITDCEVVHSTFEDSDFTQSTITRTDYSRSSVRYCMFRDTVLEAVCMPLLDIPFNFGLIERVLSDNIEITAKSRENGKEYAPKDIVATLANLLPYYTETEQSFASCNIAFALKNYKNSVDMFRSAIEQCVQQSDYRGLQNLCKLAIINDIFDRNQLRRFYEYIFANIHPTNKSYTELKRYIHSLNEIRGLLIENPYQCPTAELRLPTCIPPDDFAALTALLSLLESDSTRLDANARISFEISHQSPFDIIMKVVASTTTILPICQLVYYSVATAKATIDLKAHSAKGKQRENLVTAEGVKVDVTQNTRSISFGAFEIKLTNERKKYYGKVEDVSYVIADSSGNGSRFQSASGTIPTIEK